MNLFRNTNWYKAAFVIMALLISGVLYSQHSPVTQVSIQTSMGEIVVELYPDKAPVTARNFLKHVEKGSYTNSLFYRVVRMDNQPHSEVKIEVIQGGLFEDDILDTIAPIIHENTKLTGILHTDGVISMARMEPGTASTEFFICIGDQSSLDFGGTRNPDGQGFAAFGRVIRGMEVARAIQGEPDDGQYLLDKVSILHMKVIPSQ